MKIVTMAEPVRYALTDWDSTGNTWIELCAPRFGAEVRRSKLLTPQVTERLLGDGTLERDLIEPTDAEIMLLELWLTFHASNLEGPDGPLFKENISEQEFYAVVLKLPLDLAVIWHALIPLVAPSWR